MYGFITSATLEWVQSLPNGEELLQQLYDELGEDPKNNFYQKYSDEYTQKVVAAAGKVTGRTAEQVIAGMGDIQINNFAAQGYTPLVQALGRTFFECLQHLAAPRHRAAAVLGVAVRVVRREALGAVAGLEARQAVLAVGAEQAHALQLERGRRDRLGREQLLERAQLLGRVKGQRGGRQGVGEEARAGLAGRALALVGAHALGLGLHTRGLFAPLELPPLSPPLLSPPASHASPSSSARLRRVASLSLT